jgi:hypothetical protein
VFNLFTFRNKAKVLLGKKTDQEALWEIERLKELDRDHLLETCQSVDLVTVKKVGIRETGFDSLIESFIDGKKVEFAYEIQIIITPQDKKVTILCAKASRSDESITIFESKLVDGEKQLLTIKKEMNPKSIEVSI